MLTFSNPRLVAQFDNWPLGGNKRGKCIFHVEKDPKKGTRVGRTTTGKTKYSTYANGHAIVDGSDGRTYLLVLSTKYTKAVSVMRSDFMNAPEPYYFNKDSQEYEVLQKMVVDAV